MHSSRPSFVPSRRRWALINIVVSALAAVFIVATLNYLAARHPVRLKWLANDRFELSPLTLGILNTLTNDVVVTLYTTKDNATALDSSIEGLLAEYDFHSPRISTRQIDYLRDRKAALALENQYNLRSEANSDLILFSSGDRYRIVAHQELRDYQTAAAAESLIQGKREVKRVGFKGELLFTSAILGVTSGEPLKVAYLVGHGEHDPESENLDGYSQFRQALKEKHFSLEPHHLIQDGPLPPDTPLMIIAGPRRPFAPAELSEIEAFLTRGGRLLLLFNVNGISALTGLEKLVKKWGIHVGMNVVDDVHKLMGTELAIADYEDHPTTTPLVDAQAGLLMFLPRSVDPLPKQSLIRSEALTVQGLAFTSTNGVTKSDLRTGQPRYSQFQDRRGAIPVMVASEAEANPNAAQPLSGRTRVLVVGDSFFLTNGRIQQYGNRDFATLATGWLLDQYQLLQGIGPQPIYEFKLSIPAPEFRRLQILLLVAFPGAVFLCGMIVWWRRRI